MSGARLAFVFDDGFASDFQDIRPVFRAADAPATFAIVPDWLGEDDQLTTDQLRTLEAEGHEVLAHGRRHRYLGTYRVTADATAGDRAITVDDHVFPDEDHGVYVGDTFGVTDGEHTETVTIAGKRGTDGEPVVAFEEALRHDYDAGEAILRPTMATIDDEIRGVREDFVDLGFDPTGWVFPYDAADARAYRVAADTYGTVANASVDPRPNPPGTLPTNWRRYYLQTTHMTRPEIEAYLDAVAADGGLGILAGHSDWPSVTPERVEWTIRAAREREITVTTMAEA